MKTVTFDYRLSISFSQPVTDHRFVVCSFPQSDERQEILDINRMIKPNEFLSEGRDSFGNKYVYGNAREEHTQFCVNVSGTALTGMSYRVKADERCRLGAFAQPSGHTRGGELVCSLFKSGEIDKISGNLEKSRRIMKIAHDSIEYCPGSTNVDTCAEEALRIRKGVCQDYAHIMLSLCRMARIPCRYVVGMLIGEGASHAWVEVYDGGYWYGLDPTNMTEVSDSHVKISHGREYNDCRLNRGVFRGNALQSQEVSVKVEELYSL